MAMIADLRKELEREAEEENIPILRRAERRGKKLPAHLEAALLSGTADKWRTHSTAPRL